MNDPPPPSGHDSEPTRPAALRVGAPSSATTGHATLPSGETAVGDADLHKLFTAPEGPDEIGRIGGYRVLRLLGRGGMGAVFAADEVALDRYVAIKVMLPELAARTEARSRFLREARSAAKLDHDNVVPIYRVDEANGVPFIAMPLLTGVMLDDRLRHEPRLGAAEILQVAREVAAGLAAAHSAGLIHRDIKPGNVWLETRQNGLRVRLLDFGLARSLDGGEQLSTFRGTLVGTPAYMSPEQADGRPLDGRTDLFSLGCVLYRMATGATPFQRDSLLATLKAVGDYIPPSLASVRPDLPTQLSTTVDRLLAKDPSQRPASASEVLDLLRSDLPNPKGSWWNLRRKIAATGVASCSVIALLGARWFWDRGQTTPVSAAGATGPDSSASTLVPRPTPTVVEDDGSPQKLVADIASIVAIEAADRQIAAARLEPVVIHPDLGLNVDAALTRMLRDALSQKGLTVHDDSTSRVVVYLSRPEGRSAAATPDIVSVKLRVRLFDGGGPGLDLTYYRKLNATGLR
ncbi:MAG: serine/threonine-protein kinase [Gemmataceae bacterium]